MLCVGLLSFPAFSQVSLVSTGSVWRYLDTGVDPGPTWRQAVFDDSAWPIGPAQLGFGDGDEATVIHQTNSAGVTNLAFYFRRTFAIPDLTPYTNLLLRLRRDDGGVIYLNGMEVFRSNMPLGPVSYGTLATAVAADDGNGIFATPVPLNLLLAGNNVFAVEVHQATTNSSDISFDLELLANVQYQPPVITILSPTNAESVTSMDLPIRVSASDPDGIVSQVDFYFNGVLHGSATNAPFTWIESNVVAGAYTLVAVALDSTGLTTASAPVAVVVRPRLIPAGASWAYLDDGSDPGPAWMTPAFNDTGWSNGVAQLGFGDGDEVTLIRRFSDLTGTNGIAYYFRRAFDLPSVLGISNLVVRFIRDDGAVVYLNGAEVYRINMPAGPVGPSTFASQVIGNDNEFHGAHINPALLLPGRNVVAVEMHQFNLTSSDISFDLALLPNVPPTPPNVSVVSPTNNAVLFGPTNLPLAALALGVNDPVVSVGFLVNGILRGTDSTDTYDVDGRNYSLTASNLDAGPYILSAVATDASGMIHTSAPVSVTVLYAAVVTTLIPTGSVWKYFDAGIDQGEAWRSPVFDDSSWPSGKAKFGTNDPATTIISITPINQNITAYFRHHFSATNAASVTNLAFRVLRDDGVVGYLNGVEIFRSNMPTGQIYFSTFAPTPIGSTNENYYVPINTGSDALINGENVLAVELHQSVNTSDAGFDLGLVGAARPAAIQPALNIEISGPLLIMSWPGTGFNLQDATNVAGPYSTRAANTNSWAIPLPSGNRFYRLWKP